MNAFPKISEQFGSAFLGLTVSNDFVVQGTQVYFDLVCEAYGKTVASVSAVIEANEISDTVVWNHTSDPQNDVEIPYDLLEVTIQNIARVEDFDEVMAVQGQPFFLTRDQSQKLNELLKEFFEEEKINEIKKMAA